MNSPNVEALEFEVLRSPSSVKCWMQLVQSIQEAEHDSKAAASNATNVVYERALRANGFSYKLWMSYIKYRQEHTRKLSSIHEWFRALRDIYDRAVEKLPMMPLLWVSFIEFVMDASVPPRITLVRHTVFRALEALPVTQHHRIWKLVKQWVRRPYVPIDTAKYLWRLYLLFDTGAQRQREYFTMLWEKGSTSEFLIECAAFLSENTTAHKDLLADTSLWETIRVALETKDLRFSGDLVQLQRMVDTALQHCASPAEFRISYAVFLVGHGEFSSARQTIWVLLEDANDMPIFLRVFSLALAFEDQIIDSLAMDPEISALDDASYRRVCEKLCGDVADPLDHLKRLTERHSLLVNQLQLRSDPINTTLWLKRVELLQEMVCDNRASQSDVVALYRQSIAQCTSEFQVVGAEVAQLFESYACYLWENGSKGDAIAVVSEGAWHVHFTSAASNLLLMGLLLEFTLLTNPRDCLNGLLSKLQVTSAPNAIRSKGLVKSNVLSHLQRDSRAWILALDIAFHQLLDRNGQEQLDLVIDSFSGSSGYTAEGACYLAGRLWHRGNTNQAFREFERALLSFKGIPLALLYILQQYLSCLCISFGEQLPLYRLRELTRLGFEVAQMTMQSSPAISVEFLLNCVALESRLGLSGAAVEIAEECLQLALRYSNDSDTPLLLGLLDAVLEIALRLQGAQLVKRCCMKLLERQHLTPRFIQRVALWWAAMEKRTGNVNRAHTILEACCKSQDPSSPHGSIFWSLWESICCTAAQFEGVNKRMQQMTLKFTKNGSADTSTGSTRLPSLPAAATKTTEAV